MEEKEENSEWIRLLAENELTMKELYVCYGEKFRLFNDFWKQIAEEEQQHADWIMKLGEKAQGGAVRIDEKRFPLESIHMGIELAKSELDRVKSGEVTLIE